MQYPERSGEGSSIERKAAFFNIFQTIAIHFAARKQTNKKLQQQKPHKTIALPHYFP